MSKKQVKDYEEAGGSEGGGRWDAEVKQDEHFPFTVAGFNLRDQEVLARSSRAIIDTFCGTIQFSGVKVSR